VLALTGLFFAAFIAATLLPAQSEAVLAALVLADLHPVWLLVTVQIARAQDWYGRRGWVSLFGSWLPIIGDPLTLAAGIMREPLWRFLLVVTAAKAGRYIVLVWAVQAAV